MSSVATKLCLSQQKYVCRGKHTFVATKDVFCRDKRVFVATKMVLVADPVNARICPGTLCRRKVKPAAAGALIGYIITSAAPCEPLKLRHLNGIFHTCCDGAVHWSMAPRSWPLSLWEL